MDCNGTLRGRPPEVALLTAVHALAGVLCLARAVWPTSPGSVDLAWSLGVVGLTVAALLWTIGPRVPAATHVALVLVAGFVALQSSQATTAVEVVGLGPALIIVGFYAGHFFSPPVARVHAWLAVGLTTAGVVAARPDGVAQPWVLAVLVCVLVTEGQAQLSARMRTAAGTDPLTGVANRRAWEAEATRSLARARRAREPITIALLDLDGFKEVNDRQGHAAGDELLRTLTAQWSQRLRSSDLLGRHGGDEFVLCLPATDADGAREVLARLAEGASTSWSVGTATAGDGDSLAMLVERADTALYAAKRRRSARRGSLSTTIS
jgi:diguanylate cyclase (GGDEF)-like protein